MFEKHQQNARTVIAEIARASGLTFRYPDRMTRAEAESVIAWARGNREFMQAYEDRRHPLHAEAQSYSAWPFFFLDFPADDAGAPLEWDRVHIQQTPEEAAAAAQAELESAVAGFFAGMTPEQAAERIEAAFKDPKYQGFREAYADRKHPDHAQAVTEMSRLHQIVFPEPDTGAVARDGTGPNPGGVAVPVGTVPAQTGATGQGAGLDRETAQREIDARYGDKEFVARLQSRDPNTRGPAQAEMDRLFVIAYKESPPTEGAAPEASGSVAA